MHKYLKINLITLLSREFLITLFCKTYDTELTSQLFDNKYFRDLCTLFSSYSTNWDKDEDWNVAMRNTVFPLL